MASKTYLVNLGTMTMTDYENSMAENLGYQSTILVNGVSTANTETKSQFNRRKVIEIIQAMSNAGRLKPVVESASEDIINTNPTFS